MESWLTWRIDQLPGGETEVGLLTLAIAGLLYCFVGYRLVKLILGLTGFLLASAAGAALAGLLSQGNMIAMAVVGVLGGICGAIALLFLFRAGVFCLGLLGALLAAYHVLQGRPEAWVPWVILGAGIVGGLLALWVERPVLVLATAAIGAYLAAFAATMALLEYGLLEATGQPWLALHPERVLLGLWAVIALAGVATQLRSTRDKSKDKPKLPG